MFRFIKKVFFVGLTVLPGFTNGNSLICMPVSNQVCKARPEINNINSKNPIFYLFRGNCSNNCSNVGAIVVILMISM